MPPRTPAPHLISRLLGKHGFPRASHDKTTTGYTVAKIFHTGVPHPGTPYTAVQHNIAGMHTLRSDAEWAACRAEARRRLDEYAQVIRQAGFPAQVRDRHPELPQLTILTVAC